jgi:lipopolysaccharide export system protein LptA
MLFMALNTFSQERVSGPTTIANDDKVFLIHSDSLLFLTQPDGTELRRVVGHVQFRHKGTLMFCNLAIQNSVQNILEAYGNVRIVQGDTVTITGDTLLYYGNTRFAKVSGKTVVLKDKKRTLTTTRLEYDMNSGIAYYPNNGKTVDAENTLTSKQGYYDTRTKQFTYYKNVKLINKKYTLTTDTLFYNSITKVADYQSLTTIVSKDGTIVAKKGSYNTESGEAVFRTRTTIDNPDYTLTSDSLTFDNVSKKGFGKGKVELVSKSENVILNGDYGIYNGKAGKSKVWGHTLMRNISKEDTLFMTADTLYSIDIQPDSTISVIDSTNKDSIKIVKKLKPKPTKEEEDEKQKPRKLIGQKNVLIYRRDLQAKCDSMVYNGQDSTFTFLQKPMIWANKYQLEADSITAQMVNQKLKTMYLKVKSFVIAQDTLLNFNQVKGRRITAYFDDSTRLQKVFVEGNGESIYFALDEKNKSMGMNRVDCAKMTLNFKKNQVKKIQFVGNPDGKLTPLSKVKVDEKNLEGFEWRIKEKPTRELILSKSFIKFSTPKPTLMPPLVKADSTRPAPKIKPKGILKVGGKTLNQKQGNERN